MEKILFIFGRAKKRVVTSDMIAIGKKQTMVLWDLRERENENGKAREGAQNCEIYIR